MNFRPHEFKPSLVGLTEPKLFISRIAFNDMATLVREVSTEIGWLVTAEQRGNDFYLKKVHLFEQQVHQATTEISAEALIKLASDLCATPEGTEENNSLLCWCHSHHTMGVSPSGQDDAQMSLFKDAKLDWFIRGILNKQGVAKFDLFHYKGGYKYLDIPWEIDEPVDEARLAFWKTEIAAKVKPYTNGYMGQTHPSSYLPGGSWSASPDQYRGVFYRAVVGKAGHVYGKCNICEQSITLKRADMWTSFPKCPYEDCAKKMMAVPENWTAAPAYDYDDRRDWSDWRAKDKGSVTDQEALNHEEFFCPRGTTSITEKRTSTSEKAKDQDKVSTAVIVVSNEFTNVNPTIGLDEALARIEEQVLSEGGQPDANGKLPVQVNIQTELEP